MKKKNLVENEEESCTDRDLRSLYLRITEPIRKVGSNVVTGTSPRSIGGVPFTSRRKVNGYRRDSRQSRVRYFLREPEPSRHPPVDGGITQVTLNMVCVILLFQFPYQQDLETNSSITI